MAKQVPERGPRFEPIEGLRWRCDGKVHRLGRPYRPESVPFATWRIAGVVPFALDLCEDCKQELEDSKYAIHEKP